MTEKQEIGVNDLLLDLENPRLTEGQQNQPDTLHAMLRAETAKTLILAQSIAKEGLSPTERLIVMPSPQQIGQFIVLEGNRRLTALKVLANPALADPVLTPGQQKNLKSWQIEYLTHGAVDKVECVVFPSREEANPWIERRHRGEQGGAGVVAWGATESARFAARRSGKYSPELQVLDYVTKHAALDADTRDKLHNVSITNLDRLIADKDIRDKLGLEIDQDGHVLTRYPKKETLKGLTRIVHDLAHDKIKVKDIYTAKHRAQYLGKFKPSELPAAGQSLSAPVPLIGDGSTGVQPSAQSGATHKAASTPKPRTTVIPPTCKLTIASAKIQNIYRELRKLKLDDYPNAIAVLLRVFLELSVDEVIEKNKLMTEEQYKNAKLHNKLLKTAEHLKAKGRLNDKQVKAVTKIATDQHLFYSSVTTLHQYIHNQHFSASPSDLRAAWDNLQFLFEAIWP